MTLYDARIWPVRGFLPGGGMDISPGQQRIIVNLGSNEVFMCNVSRLRYALPVAENDFFVASPPLFQIMEIKWIRSRRKGEQKP